MTARTVDEPIDWAWDDGEGESGVHTREGKVVWWHRPGGPNGHLGEVGAEQSFEDFLTNGTWVSAPEDVIGALRERLLAARR